MSPRKGITMSCIKRFAENTTWTLVYCHGWRWITMCRLVRTCGSAFRGITFNAVDALTSWSRESVRLNKWLVLYGECEDPVSDSGPYLLGGNISVYFLFFYFSAVEFGMWVSLWCIRLCRVYKGVQKTCLSCTFMQHVCFHRDENVFRHLHTQDITILFILVS